MRQIFHRVTFHIQNLKRTSGVNLFKNLTVPRVGGWMMKQNKMKKLYFFGKFIDI